MAQRNRLSAHDTVFLDWEHPEQPMHVAECMVYDGHLTAADMIKLLSERMHLLPRYRQKIVPAPFGIARPTWEDDAAFDLRNHVAEMELPAPGDDRTLSRTCGELFCDLLDRSRPLWHLTVLHGHESGNSVVFLKLHHSMVDGVSSVELIEVLHSTKKDDAPPPPPKSAWVPRPVPDVVDQLRAIAADEAANVWDRARGITDLARPGEPTELARRIKQAARALADTAPMMLQPLPPTPFNSAISASRDFAWVELPLDEVKQVRAAVGGTINDFVLTVLSGALGRYMQRHGYDPQGRELRALCPVSVRKPDQSGDFGNLISMVVAPLYVGITDSLHRLEAERTAMEDLKSRGQAAGIHEFIASAEWWPAPLYSQIWKHWPDDYFPMHITSTNVPGPKEPLYLGGHELLHWYPVGVQWTNNGLFLCTLSYRGYLTLGPMADPQIADVWEFADDLRAAYDELRTAATGTAGSKPAVESTAATTRGRSRRRSVDNGVAG